MRRREFITLLGSAAAWPLSARATPNACVVTSANWSRSLRMSYWPMGPRRLDRWLEATRSVPIVFVQVSDPVGAGYVASLARPGGNATGFPCSNMA